MPGHPQPRVDVSGVVAMHITECTAEAVLISRHRDHMNVVGHQAIGPYLHSRPFSPIGEEIKVERVVAVFKERPFAAVAALGDVVRDSGEDCAGETGHLRWLTLAWWSVNLGVIARVTVIRA